MITTITLAPAFDRTYYVDNFTPDALNRAWQVKVNMGGKGINFSSIIAECMIEAEKNLKSFFPKKALFPTL